MRSSADMPTDQTSIPAGTQRGWLHGSRLPWLDWAVHLKLEDSREWGHFFTLSTIIDLPSGVFSGGLRLILMFFDPSIMHFANSGAQ